MRTIEADETLADLVTTSKLVVERRPAELAASNDGVANHHVTRFHILWVGSIPPSILLAPMKLVFVNRSGIRSSKDRHIGVARLQRVRDEVAAAAVERLTELGEEALPALGAARRS